ncbi:hypothetical protein PHYBOEH_000034 [Phytophthora boehmeriae]|uniref:Uncharacterized protein n=1 Tax=Phytophthora boehmeriae TaxID=109152 RepID=A0A8T1X8W5_9STRA|nr:hypothetical protein PHYBOEH_000034 [Phytophthora boehmeriae]
MEESCPVRLCVAQVHGPSVVVGAQPRNYRIGNARFNRVRVLGLCVQHIDTELKLEYQLVVPDDDQRLIEQGKKSLEIRLNAPPYSIIHVNDRIIINGKTSTKVVAVRKYARLESVLQTENVDALIPQRPGFLSVTAAVLRHYRQFFSSDEEEQSGLVVFELAVQSSSTPMSQPEWSPLVLRHLESNPDGCSAPDLRFAFPSLPLEDLMNILTNLQFDGLVIHVNNKYRSV